MTLLNLFFIRQLIDIVKTPQWRSIIIDFDKHVDNIYPHRHGIKCTTDSTVTFFTWPCFGLVQCRGSCSEQQLT